jgi:hypothetical protein
MLSSSKRRLTPITALTKRTFPQKSGTRPQKAHHKEERGENKDKGKRQRLGALCVPDFIKGSSSRGLRIRYPDHCILQVHLILPHWSQFPVDSQPGFRDDSNDVPQILRPVGFGPKARNCGLSKVICERASPMFPCFPSEFPSCPAWKKRCPAAQSNTRLSFTSKSRQLSGKRLKRSGNRFADTRTNCRPSRFATSPG